jgi:hypothetical protein
MGASPGKPRRSPQRDEKLSQRDAGRPPPRRPPVGGGAARRGPRTSRAAGRPRVRWRSGEAAAGAPSLPLPLPQSPRSPRSPRRPRRSSRRSSSSPSLASCSAVRIASNEARASAWSWRTWSRLAWTAIISSPTAVASGAGCASSSRSWPWSSMLRSRIGCACSRVASWMACAWVRCSSVSSRWRARRAKPRPPKKPDMPVVIAAGAHVVAGAVAGTMAGAGGGLRLRHQRRRRQQAGDGERGDRQGERTNVERSCGSSGSSSRKSFGFAGAGPPRPAASTSLETAGRPFPTPRPRRAA